LEDWVMTPLPPSSEPFTGLRWMRAQNGLLVLKPGFRAAV
jgi:hypothetical protein